jgi:DNA-binding CsgD family transcriptional regulator
MLAARVGLEESVVDALAHAYERWDGKGFPAGLEGEAIPLAVRIVVVARDADLAATLGEDPRVWMGERRGKAYDPSVVDAFEQVGPDVLSGLDGSDEWETALAGEPDPVVTVGEHTLDAVLAACADFADLKSAWIRGHSRSVASLAEQAGHHAGLDDSACHGLRRAGLVHDIGRVAIENGIWDKPVRSRPRSGSACGFTRTTRRGSSSAATRLLPSSDLLRPTTSASMGRGTTARCAPRRCRPPTESWRPRTCLPLSPPTARTVRHSRPTMPLAPSKPSAASTLLQSAVCSPQPASGRRRGRPAGPRTSRTERWRCVLRLIARGGSNREVAERLFISAKTVGRHVENVYTKIGVSSRAAAAVFAMEHRFLD